MAKTIKDQNTPNTPFLFVDAGNLLGKQTQIGTGPSPERLTAEGIIKIYTAMKVDGVAIGPFDLAAGLDLLHNSQKQGFPWLSANLLDDKGKPLFPQARIKKIGKITAGIIGMTSIDGTGVTLPPAISCAKWQTVLPELIEKTAKKCDILILLSTLNPEENKEIAQQFPALHILLTANHSAGNMSPKQINTAMLTQTDRQGKYQGILTIDWHSGGKWGTGQTEEMNALRNQLGALNRQLQRMQQKQDEHHPEYTEKIKVVAVSKAEVEKEIQKREQPPTDSTTSQASILSYTFLALIPSIPEDPHIKSMVAEIKQKVIAFHQGNSNADASGIPSKNQPPTSLVRP